MEIKGREYPVKTFAYVANFVMELKGLEFTLSAEGTVFSLVNVLIYLLNFIVTKDFVATRERVHLHVDLLRPVNVAKDLVRRRTGPSGARSVSPFLLRPSMTGRSGPSRTRSNVS